MKREFTTREKGLLLVLVVLIMVLSYWKLIWEPIHDQITELDHQTQQTQLLIDQQTIQLTKMKRMQKLLEEMKESGSYEAIPAFDNGGAVTAELHTVLAAARDYALDFEATKTDAHIVSRPIAVRFTADSYETARSMLDQLSQSTYFNLITDLDIQWQAQSCVTVSLCITYYEVIPQG